MQSAYGAGDLFGSLGAYPDDCLMVCAEVCRTRDDRAVESRPQAYPGSSLAKPFIHRCIGRFIHLQIVRFRIEIFDDEIFNEFRPVRA